MSEGEKVTELTKQSAPTAKAPVVPQIETERWVDGLLIANPLGVIAVTSSFQTQCFAMK